MTRHFRYIFGILARHFRYTKLVISGTQTHLRSFIHAPCANRNTRARFNLIFLTHAHSCAYPPREIFLTFATHSPHNFNSITTMGGLFLKPHFSGCLNHSRSSTVFSLQKAVGRAWAVSGKIRAAQPLSNPIFAVSLFLKLSPSTNRIKSVNRRKGI